MTRILALILIYPLLMAAQERKRPAQPKRQAEIQLRIIEASSSGDNNDAAQLVPAELKSLLKYSRYSLLDSAFLRATQDSQHTIALAGDLRGEVEFDIPLEGEIEIDVELRRGNRVLLETKATTKNGETVVLGASRMRDGSNALIVLVTAKLLP